MDLARFNDQELAELAVRATLHIQQTSKKIDHADDVGANENLMIELYISGDVLDQVDEERKRRLAAA